MSQLSRIHLYKDRVSARCTAAATVAQATQPPMSGEGSKRTTALYEEFVARSVDQIQGFDYYESNAPYSLP